jgi:Ni,Fe-hydrogenase III small subunit
MQKSKSRQSQYRSSLFTATRDPALADETRELKLPEAAHTSRPWRIHEFTRDFRLEDVRALPTPGGPDDFARLVQLIASFNPSRSRSIPVRTLFAIRRTFGALLGWDEPDVGHDCERRTLRDRLPADLREARPGPSTHPFNSLYVIDDEWATEIVNRTVHAVMHVGWVPNETGGYRGQMARIPVCTDRMSGARAAERGRDRRRRESTRRDRLHPSPRTWPRRPAPPPHRLIRQLARAGACRGGQPAARLPADQQELRTLLRLRGPLMFVLLRQLAALRRDVALRASDRGRSLAIRHVDAGSCNGCEHELQATASAYYDLSRFGLGIVASPRHADVLLVTGAVTTRMAEPLLLAYASMPEPRLVAALGDCALGCNLLGHEVVGPLESVLPVDLRIPGCPPPPDRIAGALIEALDRRS